MSGDKSPSAPDVPAGADVPTHADVVVVGAGLAGLAAARTLQGNGLHTVVLEGAARLGGRVATDTIDGWQADVGFQLLNPTYPALRHYVDVAALRLQPIGVGVVTHLGADRRILLADPRSDRQALTHLPRIMRMTTPNELLALARYVTRAALLPVNRLVTAPDVGWHAALDHAGIDGGLRRAVLEPFLTGTLADAEGTTSRRYVDLVLRSFIAAALGSPPGLPVGGMTAFAQAVAAPIADQVVTGVPAEHLTRRDKGWLVATPGGDIACRAVVVATDATASARLLDRPPPAVRALTTFWHVTAEPAAPPDRARYLHIDGTGSHGQPGGLVNTVVISRNAPSYVAAGAAEGADLVATTILGASPSASADAEASARRHAVAVLGGDARTWQLLTTHRIAAALPVAAAPLAVRSPIDLGDGLVVVGDHRDTPSIQGALASGRRGALGVLNRLVPNRGPEPAAHPGGHGAR